MEQIRSNPVAPGIEKSSSISNVDSEEVRVLGMSEYLPAAQCLAEAFDKDVVARYFIDTEDMASYSEEYKWNLHYDIMRFVTAAHCFRGIVTTIGPNYDAVALWMPPSKNMDDWWTIIRSGMWRLYYRLSREGKMRFYTEFLPLLHVTKAEVLAERDDQSYYLVYIGTKASARGKGYGRKLIEHGFKMADRDGYPTYLESSSDTNVPYYEKLGFAIKKKVCLQRAREPINLHIMVREPNPAGAAGPSKLKSGATLAERPI